MSESSHDVSLQQWIARTIESLQIIDLQDRVNV